MKGILSPVDFAIAFAVVFAVITFTAFYITGWSSSQVSIGRAADIETASKEIGKTLFETQGTPADWEISTEETKQIGLADYVYQIPVIVKEYTPFYQGQGASHVDDKIDVPINFSHEAKSIRVYDEQMNEVPSQLISDGVRFQVNLNPRERKTYYILYSSVYFEPDWWWASPNASGTMQIQVLEETPISIISKRKLNRIDTLKYENVKKYFGNRDFTIKIDGWAWVQATEIPTGMDIAIYSAPLLVQDEKGTLKPKIGKVIVW